jgi:hypothetical protein
MHGPTYHCYSKESSEGFGGQGGFSLCGQTFMQVPGLAALEETCITDPAPVTDLNTDQALCADAIVFDGITLNGGVNSAAKAKQARALALLILGGTMVPAALTTACKQPTNSETPAPTPIKYDDLADGSLLNGHIQIENHTQNPGAVPTQAVLDSVARIVNTFGTIEANKNLTNKNGTKYYVDSLNVFNNNDDLASVFRIILENNTDYPLYKVIDGQDSAHFNIDALTDGNALTAFKEVIILLMQYKNNEEELKNLPEMRPETAVLINTARHACAKLYAMHYDDGGLSISINAASDNFGKINGALRDNMYNRGKWWNDSSKALIGKFIDETEISKKKLVEMTADDDVKPILLNVLDTRNPLFLLDNEDVLVENSLYNQISGYLNKTSNDYNRPVIPDDQYATLDSKNKEWDLKFQEQQQIE